MLEEDFSEYSQNISSAYFKGEFSHIACFCDQIFFTHTSAITKIYFIYLFFFVQCKLYYLILSLIKMLIDGLTFSVLMVRINKIMEGIT